MSVHQHPRLADYDHIYLSPHLDDVVLACAGRIARQRAAGAAVLVVTVFAGEHAGPGQAAATRPLAPFQDVAARRREDRRALEVLGADYRWLDFPDAIQRRPRYRSLPGITAPVGRREAALAAALAAAAASLHRQWPAATLYFPLGIGNHVDHQLVFGAGLALTRHIAPADRIRFYEDTPYVCIPNLLRHRLEQLGMTGAAGDAAARTAGTGPGGRPTSDDRADAAARSPGTGPGSRPTSDDRADAAAGSAGGGPGGRPTGGDCADAAGAAVSAAQPAPTRATAAAIPRAADRSSADRRQPAAAPGRRLWQRARQTAAALAEVPLFTPHLGGTGRLLLTAFLAARFRRARAGWRHPAITLARESVAIDEMFPTKLAAISCYASQVPTLFGDHERLRSTLAGAGLAVESVQPDPAASTRGTAAPASAVPRPSLHEHYWRLTASPATPA